VDFASAILALERMSAREIADVLQKALELNPNNLSNLYLLDISRPDETSIDIDFDYSDEGSVPIDDPANTITLTIRLNTYALASDVTARAIFFCDWGDGDASFDIGEEAARASIFDTRGLILRVIDQAHSAARAGIRSTN